MDMGKMQKKMERAHVWEKKKKNIPNELPGFDPPGCSSTVTFSVYCIGISLYGDVKSESEDPVTL